MMTCEVQTEKIGGGRNSGKEKSFHNVCKYKKKKQRGKGIEDMREKCGGKEKKNEIEKNRKKIK